MKVGGRDPCIRGVFGPSQLLYPRTMWDLSSLLSAHTEFWASGAMQSYITEFRFCNFYTPQTIYLNREFLGNISGAGS